MKLKTGKIAFPIEFDNGEKMAIYFNPSDPDLMIRMRDLQKNINEKIGKAEDIPLNADGTPEKKDDVEAYENLMEIFKNELDTAFGGEISAVVFKYCSPLAIVDGEYFVLQFIEAIIPEIEKEITKARAESEKRIEKHLAKYAK